MNPELAELVKALRGGRGGLRFLHRLIRTLIIPSNAGPNDPAIVIGPDIPTELTTFYSGIGTLVSAIIYRADADSYVYDLLLTVGGFPYRATGICNNGTITESYSISTSKSLYGLWTVAPAGTISWSALSTLQAKSGAIIDIADANDFAVTTKMTKNSYTPALQASVTNPTLSNNGTHSQLGVWTRNPFTGLYTVDVVIRFGTAGVNAGSGTYMVTMPAAINSQVNISAGMTDQVGYGSMRDDSGTTYYVIIGEYLDNGGPSGVGRVRFHISAVNTFVTNNAPFTWAASDGISLRCQFY